MAVDAAEPAGVMDVAAEGGDRARQVLLWQGQVARDATVDGGLRRGLRCVKQPGQDEQTQQTPDEWITCHIRMPDGR